MIAEAAAHRLPGTEALDEYRTALQEVVGSPPDDAVRILAGEGTSFRQMRETARRMREAVTPSNLEMIGWARVVANQMWPVLRGRPDGQEAEERAGEVAELLASLAVYEHIGRLDALAKVVEDRYRALYQAKHVERASGFAQAVEEVKGHPEWAAIPEETVPSVLAPLTARACAALNLPRGAAECTACRASVSQMESDLAVLSGLKANVLARVEELTAPERRIERVRLASYFDGALETNEDVEGPVGRLRDLSPRWRAPAARGAAAGSLPTDSGRAAQARGAAEWSRRGRCPSGRRLDEPRRHRSRRSSGRRWPVAR